MPPFVRGGRADRSSNPPLGAGACWSGKLLANKTAVETVGAPISLLSYAVEQNWHERHTGRFLFSANSTTGNAKVISTALAGSGIDVTCVDPPNTTSAPAVLMLTWVMLVKP